MYDPQLLQDARREEVVTEYGSVSVQIGRYQGIEIAFIPRHGEKHSVPPHMINYRANIKALQQLGVEKIVATTAVGSMNIDMQPGHYVICNQFLDFTKNREHTYFAGGDCGVQHCDMSRPYCPDLGQALLRSAQEKGLVIHPEGCYVCSEGPRFETAAEIRMFQILGGDVAGMTGVPEVCLARELGICYANLSIVTNLAAGISRGQLTHGEVVDAMQQSIVDVRSLVMDSFKYVQAQESCACRAQLLNKTEA